MVYRLVGHTADVAIEAEGESAALALGDAALALAEVIAGRPMAGAVSTSSGPELTADADALDSLAVAFLAEVLWRYDEADLLWVGGDVEVDGNRAAASPRWRRHRPGDGQGVEVKAITYHDASLRQRGDHWHLRVVLDL